MIAISYTAFTKHGCPYCGCDSARGGNVSGGGSQYGTCRECSNTFIILNDGVLRSQLGVYKGKDENGKSIYEYPNLQEHPRKGIPWHPWIQPDLRPEEGEYWKPRGIGYDLSGFVKSKQAGKRLLSMVKMVLDNENPDSWLDWREYEPEWIQFKFQKNEFDLEKLYARVSENKDIITLDILKECMIKEKLHEN